MIKVISCHFNLLPYHTARYEGFLEECEDVQLEVVLLRPTEEYAEIREDYGEEMPFELRRAGVSEGNSKRERRDKIGRAIRSADPDVSVLLGGYGMGAMLDVLEYSLEEGIGTVLCSESKRDDKGRSFFKEVAKSGIVRSVDSFLVGGTPHVEYMSELGAGRDDIFTGYDVVDNEYFREESTRSKSLLEEVGGRYFLASNRFVSRKNIPRLVRAYQSYRSQATDPWKLVLLGDGPERTRVGKLISDRAITGVVLPGFKQIKRLPAYYGSAECFIHPALQEQWGLVVNEAMASGLPVLVSETAGCRYDLVHEGENGLLFNPVSEDEIAERMCNIHQMSDEKRKKMGKRSEEIIANWGPRRFGKGLKGAVGRALSNDAKGWKGNLTKQVVRSFLAIRRME